MPFNPSLASEFAPPGKNPAGAHGPYVVARAGLEPTTIQRKALTLPMGHPAPQFNNISERINVQIKPTMLKRIFL